MTVVVVREIAESGLRRLCLGSDKLQHLSAGFALSLTLVRPLTHVHAISPQPPPLHSLTHVHNIMSLPKVSVQQLAVSLYANGNAFSWLANH
jgi:hypothetical protein